METNFSEYVNEIFKRHIAVDGLQIKTELNEGRSYVIEYRSGSFVIKVEKYFREFYVTLYKLNKPDEEINLFNLLEYLRRGDTQIPKSEYFHNEKNINECYRKQLNHISETIHANYGLISDFFSDIDYEIRRVEFENYWKKMHPESWR